MENVFWTTIPGYGEKYQVSKTGIIRNVLTGKILKPIKRQDGYLVVNLSYQNKAKQIMIHRLVAEAFINNPSNYPVVNHIDGNKTNASAENLEWVTASENSLHAFRIGLNSISEKCKKAVSKIAAVNGAKTTSKPVKQITDSGIVLAVFPSIREAERVTGIKKSTIQRSCRHPYYRAGGFLWRKC